MNSNDEEKDDYQQKQKKKKGQKEVDDEDKKMILDTSIRNASNFEDAFNPIDDHSEPSSSFYQQQHATGFAAAAASSPSSNRIIMMKTSAPSSPSEKLVLRKNLCKLKLPFPWKLHQLLDDVVHDGYEHIISWIPGGKAFKVHNPDFFAKMIMPNYFRQTKFSSFTRQLYIYGFTKIEGGMDHGAYFHERFVQGDKSASMTLERNAHQDRRIKDNHPTKAESNTMFLPGGGGGGGGGSLVNNDMGSSSFFGSSRGDHNFLQRLHQEKLGNMDASSDSINTPLAYQPNSSAFGGSSMNSLSAQLGNVFSGSTANNISTSTDASLSQGGGGGGRHDLQMLPPRRTGGRVGGRGRGRGVGGFTSYSSSSRPMSSSLFQYQEPQQEQLQRRITEQEQLHNMSPYLTSLPQQQQQPLWHGGSSATAATRTSSCLPQDHGDRRLSLPGVPSTSTNSSFLGSGIGDNMGLNSYSSDVASLLNQIDRLRASLPPPTIAAATIAGRQQESVGFPRSDYNRNNDNRMPHSSSSLLNTEPRLNIEPRSIEEMKDSERSWGSQEPPRGNRST